MAATMENIYRLLKLFKSSQKIASCLHRNHVRTQLMRNRWSAIQKFSIVKLWSRPTAFTSIGTVSAVSWLTKKTDAETEKVPQGKTIVEEADKLYDANQTIALYTLLSNNLDENDDEMLWRLARACCDMSKMSKNDIKSQEYMIEGFELVKKALKLNDNNFASHKWYAILLDKTAGYVGTGKRIEEAFTVKEHFMKAVELNPKDATSMYSLGHWCYLFADMPWYTKKLASAIFSTPPSSSFEEALKYLEMAEEVDPDFYIWNHVYLGKTYLKVGQREKAEMYLDKARAYEQGPNLSVDEHEAQMEAFRVMLAAKMIDRKGVKLIDQTGGTK